MFPIIAISLIEKCKLKIRFFFSLPSFLIAIYGIKVWRNVLKKTVSAFELNNFTGDFVSSLFGLRVHLWQRIFLQRNYYQFFCFTCELITHNSFLTLFLTSLLCVLNLWRISLWLAKVVDPYSSKIAEFPANNSTYNFTCDFVSSLFGLRVHLWQRIYLQRNYYQFFCFTCELITHNSFLTLFLTSLLCVLNLWRISLWLAKVVDPYSSKIAEFPANNSTYRAAKSCRAVVLKKLVGKRRLTCEEEPRKAVLFYYDGRWALLSENIPSNSFLELK